VVRMRKVLLILAFAACFVVAFSAGAYYARRQVTLGSKLLIEGIKMLDEGIELLDEGIKSVRG